MHWNKQALKKWIWWSNPKDSPKKIALIRTLQVHVFLMLFFSLGYTATVQRTTPPIRIKTHTLQMTVTPKVIPKKTSTSPPKTIVKKENLKPKEAPKKKPIDRIKELDNSLKKLENSLKNPPKNLVVEMQVPPTKLPTQSQATSYETQLIQLLQASLKLIDVDPVDVTITVQPNGIVATILDIDSLSPLNAKIVEGTLNRMVFPTFEGDQPMEFTLHLCTDSSPL